MRNYLDDLSDRNSFCYNQFEKYYPGLRQKIERINISPEVATKSKRTSKDEVVEPIELKKELGSNIQLSGSLYNLGYAASKKDTGEYKLRLCKTVSHTLVGNPFISMSTNRRGQLR